MFILNLHIILIDPEVHEHRTARMLMSNLDLDFLLMLTIKVLLECLQILAYLFLCFHGNLGWLIKLLGPWLSCYAFENMHWQKEPHIVLSIRTVV